jgi:hypothetical protein
MAGLNWPGLMAWSTKYHDGTAPSQFKVLSGEDRAFLERAMEEAFGHIEDPNKALQEAIGQVEAADRTDESICTSLEVIDRLCDDVDVARNVEKLNGLQPLLDLASSKGGAIRERTLEILALLFSNNAKIQEAGIKRDALQAFLKLTKEAPVGSQERSKAFRAIVALIRTVPEFEDAFLHAQSGLQLMVLLLDPAEDARTREKVASFALSCTMNGQLKDEEIGILAGALAPLIINLASGGIQYREVLSDCAQQFAGTAPGKCPVSLSEAVQARLAELRGAIKEEGDNGTEEANLQECLTKL